MWDKITDAYNSIPDWLHPIRDWTLRALIAAVFLSIWMSVATFSYALRYGARPPIDGIPFLSFIAGLTGLLLAVATYTFIFFLPMLSKFYIMVWEKSNVKNSRNAKEYVVSIMYYIVYIIVLVLPLVYVLLNMTGGLILLSRLDSFIFKWLAWLVSVGVGGVIGYLLVLAMDWFNDHGHVWSKRVGVFLYFSSIIVIAFSSLWTPFDHVMRATQFGGGAKVNILMRDDTRLDSAYLFLLSERNITVWNDQSGRFSELNRDHVLEVEYLPNDEWKLPKQRSLGEIIGFTQVEDIEKGITQSP